MVQARECIGARRVAVDTQLGLSRVAPTSLEPDVPLPRAIPALRTIPNR
jgi:hypothetical protein